MLTFNSRKLEGFASEDSKTCISSTFSSPSGLGAVNSSTNWNNIHFSMVTTLLAVNICKILLDYLLLNV